MLKFGTISTVTLFLVFALFLSNYFFSTSLWWCALPFLLWFVLTIIGSFHIQWNYHLISLHKKKSVIGNHVALTFDDGPHPEFTTQVLQLLEKYKAKATFFCIGKNVENHPGILRQIIANGHIIGNHTYSHSNDFGFFGTKKVISELRLTNAVVENIIQKKMRLYRPAFGVTNPKIKRALQKTGLQSIGWSVRSLDTTQLHKETVLKRITSQISKGDIILLHDTSAKTVAVLEQLLLFLREKQLQSVTVDQLLDIDPYA